MKNAFLFLLAAVGLPLTWAIGRTCVEGLAAGLSDGNLLTAGRLAFIGGAATMTWFYFWKGREWYVLYVFAHEMTHAVVGLCCFAKIHSITINKTNGCVVLSKDNVAISLAPYCVPFYLLIALVCCAILIRIWPQQPFWPWAALFGALALFHVLYTIDALVSTAQSDVRVYGRFFSYWLIITVNLLIATFALSAANILSFDRQAATLQHHATTAYSALWHNTRSLVTRLAA